ncbi:beta strand repeat-containing protein, partial [Inquilinus sp. CA228]|uniref:beta strand repeat-containing protein n=1 Tax=Inquilinus sp. CA228 TaxID=3455609 RepID=UPI003F8D8EB7
MTSYLFSVDGQETGTVFGDGVAAFVDNLDFFDTEDIVAGVPGGQQLQFVFAGDMVLNLAGYNGISGFSRILAEIDGLITLAIGQDFYDSNASGGYLYVQGESLSDATVTLDASALGAASAVYLRSVSAGNDVLTGGQGDDTLVGEGAGADQLNGGGGDDLLRFDYSPGGVTVDLAAGTGSGGDAQGDTYTSIENVIGSGFADRLTGDAGSNSLLGGAGADQLDGGGGIDFLRFDLSPDGVTVDLAAGTASGGDAQGDTYTSFENVVGSGFADRLTGDAGSNALVGLEGDDTLQGGAGDDELDGGGGSDFANYQGSTQAVTVNLLAGSASGGDAQGDTLTSIENLYGSSHNDVLTGSADNNSLEGYGGADTLNGDAGNDELGGGDGDDALNGGAGIDRLFGDAGDDILNGGDGNDYLFGDAGDDILNGGEGLDTVTYAFSSAAVIVTIGGVGLGGEAQGDVVGTDVESIEGSNGFNDILTGSAGDNGLFGFAGNDLLVGLAGADSLNGGSGDDVLQGGAGADTLSGSGGDDVIQGGAGADTLSGGAGIDTLNLIDLAAGVMVDLAAIALAGTGTVAGDTVDASFENVYGSAVGGDTLSGDGSANWLFGYGGNDTLGGAGGTDVLDGGDGQDTLIGGAGMDLLYGGAGTDTASYAASAAAVRVDLSVVAAAGGDAQGDILQGIENLEGSAGNDILDGDALANTLAGGAGNDVLSGKGGNDLLRAGAGADALDGGTGIDTASYFDSGVGVTVNLATGAGTGGDAQGDTLAGVENVNGSQFGDSLTGNAGANA